MQGSIVSNERGDDYIGDRFYQEERCKPDVGDRGPVNISTDGKKYTKHAQLKRDINSIYIHFGSFCTP